MIDERFDIELIDAVAQMRPDWHLVMIGPVVKIDPADLPRRANIHYLGRADFARSAAEAAGLDMALVEERSTQSLNLAAPRPRYSVLTSERAWLLPSLDNALARYLRDCQVRWMDGASNKQSAAAPRARAATNKF